MAKEANSGIKLLIIEIHSRKLPFLCFFFFASHQDLVPTEARAICRIVCGGVCRCFRAVRKREVLPTLPLHHHGVHPAHTRAHRLALNHSHDPLPANQKESPNTDTMKKKKKKKKTPARIPGCPDDHMTNNQRRRETARDGWVYSASTRRKKKKKSV